MEQGYETGHIHLRITSDSRNELWYLHSNPVDHWLMTVLMGGGVRSI